MLVDYKESERRLEVMQTTILRWPSGITRLDHIRKGITSNRYGVAPKNHERDIFDGMAM